MHQRSSVGDGRFLPTSSDVTNQWPGLVSRRCCNSPGLSGGERYKQAKVVSKNNDGSADFVKGRENL
ncbi:hypothetical protein TNCV_3364681 [Trichonephila clavipes]|nr:hypothetical protein TNCV_3364681 [Trichonephila clavipes]